MSWGVSPGVYPVWDSLSFLDLGDYFLPLNGEGNNHPSPRNPENPKQDKPKVKHPKTHINQNTKIKHKEQILKAARGFP